MKNKIYNIILVLLIVIVIIVIGYMIYTVVQRQENEKVLSNVIEQIEDIANDNKEEQTLKIEGYDYEVEGIIEIPKLNIKYPIVSDSSDEAMNVAIIKYWGGKINDFGNYSIAGHNYKDGTMFGRTRQLEIGDKIYLTDLKLNTIEYEIFDKFNVDPNDVSILETNDKTIREVTLITCTNGHKERLILKAREII